MAAAARSGRARNRVTAVSASAASSAAAAPPSQPAAAPPETIQLIHSCGTTSFPSSDLWRRFCLLPVDPLSILKQELHLSQHGFMRPCHGFNTAVLPLLMPHANTFLQRGKLSLFVVAIVLYRSGALKWDDSASEGDCKLLSTPAFPPDSFLFHSLHELVCQLLLSEQLVSHDIGHIDGREARMRESESECVPPREQWIQGEMISHSTKTRERIERAGMLHPAHIPSVAGGHAQSGTPHAVSFVPVMHAETESHDLFLSPRRRLRGQDRLLVRARDLFSSPSAELFFIRCPSVRRGKDLPPEAEGEDKGKQGSSYTQPVLAVCDPSIDPALHFLYRTRYLPLLWANNPFFIFDRSTGRFAFPSTIDGLPAAITIAFAHPVSMRLGVQWVNDVERSVTPIQPRAKAAAHDDEAEGQAPTFESMK